MIPLDTHSRHHFSLHLLSFIALLDKRVTCLFFLCIWWWKKNIFLCLSKALCSFSPCQIIIFVWFVSLVCPVECKRFYLCFRFILFIHLLNEKFLRDLTLCQERIFRLALKVFCTICLSRVFTAKRFPKWTLWFIEWNATLNFA